MVDVLCIGHACYDLSVFFSGFPREDSKTETDQLLEAGGGPAANAAYLLSSWGIGCAFAGLLGDDAFGKKIRAEFAAVGTNVSLVAIRPGYETPVSLILVNVENGSRTLVNRKARGANLQISLHALKTMAPRFLLFDGHQLKASLAALKLFPKAISILDAGSLREGTSRLAHAVDYLVASEKFALQVCKPGVGLGNAQTRRHCLGLLQSRYQNPVVITLGERGLIAHDGRRYYRMPAFATKPVDTTAAGDVFHGSFVYGLLQGMGFPELLRFASMAASLSVRKRGGRPSIPSLPQVQRALAHAE